MIFNKTKRQSFMPESTKMKLDTSALASTSKDAETTRKALTSRDHASMAFSSAPVTYVTLNVCLKTSAF